MKILVIGGTGFIGKEIVQQLQAVHEVKILSRKESADANAVRGDITDFGSLHEIGELKFDLIINCVGLSPIKYHPDEVYYKTHVLSIENILKLMDQQNIPSLIHLSAIGVESDSDFIYMKTKLEAEELIKNSNVNYIIIRPSLVLGQNNELEGMISSLSLMDWTILPIFGGIFQPIHVNELATFINSAVGTFGGTHISDGILEIEEENTIIRKIIEVGGPNIYQLSEVISKNAELLGIKVIKLRVPKFMINGALGVGSMLHLTNRHIDKYVWKDSIVKLDCGFIGNSKYF